MSEPLAHGIPPLGTTNSKPLVLPGITIPAGCVELIGTVFNDGKLRELIFAYHPNDSKPCEVNDGN